MSKWPVQSVEEFEKMATTDPKKFVKWIKSGTISSGRLTFAAEILGKVKNSLLVVPLLLDLTHHREPLVREGAIYGLEHHLSVEGVRERLEFLKKFDTSMAVSEVAQDTLNLYEDGLS